MDMILLDFKQHLKQPEPFQYRTHHHIVVVIQQEIHLNQLLSPLFLEELSIKFIKL